MSVLGGGEDGEGWWGLGATFWEERGYGVGEGCRGTIKLTSTIRMLKITPLILTYKKEICLSEGSAGVSQRALRGSL